MFALLAMMPDRSRPVSRNSSVQALLRQSQSVRWTCTAEGGQHVIRDEARQVVLTREDQGEAVRDALIQAAQLQRSVVIVEGKGEIDSDAA